MGVISLQYLWVPSTFKWERLIINSIYIYIYGGDRTGRYLGGHLKILPTIMLSNVERINE